MILTWMFLLVYFQVVIVPIWKTDDEKTGVMDAAMSVEKMLKEVRIRVKLDDSQQRTPGWKFNFWEMKVMIFILSLKIHLYFSIFLIGKQSIVFYFLV